MYPKITGALPDSYRLTTPGPVTGSQTNRLLSTLNSPNPPYVNFVGFLHSFHSIMGTSCPEQSPGRAAVWDEDPPCCQGFRVSARCRAVLFLQVVVVWNTAQVTCGGDVVVLAKAHTGVDIQTLKIAFFDDTR